MAADKYLVNHFGKPFFGHVKSKLNAKSSCLIYDQLVKIGEREEIRLAEVRSVIIENSRETIESEHFKQIDQETLISLLSLDELDIDEADLLAAVSKWLDCEVQRQGMPVNRENRRKVFEPIKSYVLFTAFEPEKVAKCKLIADLLTREEAGSIVLHLLNKDWPLMIELKTSRSAGARGGARSVFVSTSFPANLRQGTRSVCLHVNQRVSIRTVYSTYSSSSTYPRFQVINYSTGANLNLKVKRSAKDGKVCFSLNPPWELEADQLYTLCITCNRDLNSEDRLTQGSLSYRSTAFNLSANLSPFDGFHFVRGLEFVPL